VIIVGIDPCAVEADLLARRLACPNCASGLRPWGHGIEREVRLVGAVTRRRPRRAICSGCGVTHVVQAADTLTRRRDGVDVVGAALRASAMGTGHRRIAAALGRPAATVRGWLRRFRARATDLRDHFTLWAHVVDPTHDHRSPGGSAVFDAVEAIGVLAVVATRRFGPREPWHLASFLTGGALLANTSSPFRRPS
jgi:transposase-like protein